MNNISNAIVIITCLILGKLTGFKWYLILFIILAFFFWQIPDSKIRKKAYQLSLTKAELEVTKLGLEIKKLEKRNK